MQDIGALGRLSLHLSYSNELKHTYQAYITDPVIDLLRRPDWSTDFKTKTNASLTWSKNTWSATLFANRYGAAPNNLASLAGNYSDPGTGKLPAWTLYNASVTYNPVHNLGLSFSVNNLFNKMPPTDHGYNGLTAKPYNIFNYNAFGRAMYIEANYKFGSTGS